jgi:hypothetical protein
VVGKHGATLINKAANWITVSSENYVVYLRIPPQEEGMVQNYYLWYSLNTTKGKSLYHVRDIVSQAAQSYLRRSIQTAMTYEFEHLQDW